MRYVLAIAAIMVLSGCASGALKSLPAVTGDSATISIIRENSFVGATNSYNLTLDGAEIFAIRSGQATSLMVKPGKYGIGVRCFGGLTPTWKEDNLQIDIANGVQAYLLVSPSVSCASIKQISDQEGRLLISESDIVPMSYQ